MYVMLHKMFMIILLWTKRVYLGNSNHLIAIAIQLDKLTKRTMCKCISNSLYNLQVEETEFFTQSERMAKINFIYIHQLDQ